MGAGGFTRPAARLASLVTTVLALLAFAAGCGASGSGGLGEYSPAGNQPAGGRVLRRGEIPSPVADREIAAVLAELENSPAPEGVDSALWQDLRSALAGQLGSRGVSRVASAAPGSAASQVTQFTPLAADGSIRFLWQEANQGDYDHNGIVSVQDLVQVGLFFGLDNAASNWSEARAADGNGDGLVNVQDVTPIGSNFLNAIAGYNVYRALGLGSAPELVASLPRSAALEANAEVMIYDFTDSSLPEGAADFVYEVRPYAPGGAAEEGICSYPYEVSLGGGFGEHLQPASAALVDENGTGVAVLQDELLLNYVQQPSQDELFGLVYSDLDAKLLGQIPGNLTYRIGFENANADMGMLKSQVQAAAGAACSVDFDFLAEPSALSTAPGREASKTYSDPRRAELWGLDAVNADNAWDVSEGSGVVVAVIDTGVETSHEDLLGQTVTGARFGGVEPWSDDSNGHGTHVAGTIAAAGDNGLGIVGLAPAAKIMPLRAGSVISGSWRFPASDLTSSINYAVNNGAQVINMSLGGVGSTMGSAFEAALANAEAAGVVVCVAAGNSNMDAGGYVPALYPTVLCVGAIGPDMSRAGYSNYGSVVDVCAPGGDIVSSYSEGILSSVPTTNSSYSFYQGTSMACPHAAAFCALLLAANPDLSPADVRLKAAETGRVLPESDQIGPLIDAEAALAALDSFGVSGSVKRSDGLGISGVTVTLSDGVVEFTATTTSSGSFSLSGAPTGTYVLSPLRAGWRFEPESMEVVLSGASYSGADFEATQVGIFETENNDNAAQANALPAFPFTSGDWGGSLGSGTDYVATDGDAVDIFSFTLDNPARVYFELGFDGTRANLDLRLLGTNGTTVVASSALKSGSTEALSYSLSQPGTYYVSCVKVSGYSDYTLAGDAKETHSLSGRILNSSGAAVANVVLNLNSESDSFSVKTGASGSYSFSGVPDGSYVLVPKLAPRSFLPESSDVVIAGEDLTDQDFTAVGPFTVTGRVTNPAGTGINGAKLTLAAEGRLFTATSNSTGAYTINNVLNGDYALKCEAAGRTFTPEGSSVTVDNANVTGQDFVGVGPFTVGGTVTQNGLGLTGVNLTLSGGGKTYTAKSITAGKFTVAGVPNGTYTLTPSMTGRTFTPAVADVTVDGANVTGLAFTAIGPFTVSGSVTKVGSATAIAAVKLTLTGARGTFTATTATNGSYTIKGVPNGDYTLSASKTGHSFAPSSIAVSVDSGNVTGMNFSGRQVFSVAGRITKGAVGVAGIVVEVSNADGTYTATTTSLGYFTITGVPAGSYTVTPTTSGRSYTPSSRSITITTGNLTNQNFSST
ncbi:DUF2012 domain-containing protein [bacterium]|nr:DUF2012 domain-containing protein [bacterium]